MFVTHRQTLCQKEFRADRERVFGVRKSAPYVAMGSRRSWAILCARKGRTLALGGDSLFTKDKEALPRARRREKCCWELREGVSQKPSHLTTCGGWKTRPERVIGA